MEPIKTEVVIVGAGPGGYAAAFVLLRKQVDVTTAWLCIIIMVLLAVNTAASLVDVE